MPQTHGVGRLYWHRVRLQNDAPRHHRWPTFEYEWPHRQSQAHVVRLLGKLGIAYGLWHGDKLAEDEAAFKATMGHYERGDVKGDGGESVDEHRQRRMDEAAVPEGWTVVPL